MALVVRAFPARKNEYSHTCTYLPPVAVPFDFDEISDLEPLLLSLLHEHACIPEFVLGHRCLSVYRPNVLGSHALAEANRVQKHSPPWSVSLLLGLRLVAADERLADPVPVVGLGPAQVVRQYGCGTV
jgi:hypothetical protein